MKSSFTLLLLAGSLFYSGCAQPNLVKQSRPALGAIVEIQVADQDKSRQEIDSAISQAFAEINRVEDLFSKFKPESEISRINAQAALRPVKVSPETFGLIEQALYFSRLSQGAFDITVGPLTRLWGFNAGPGQQRPSAEELSNVLAQVGYQNIKLNKEDQSIFFTRPGMSLDLGGIAAGYAVDRAAAVLKRAGVRQALINAGGDIYVLGSRRPNQSWQAAIQHPGKADVMLGVLELTNRAVATSGDYRKYIELDGRRYSHIINPLSGYPCEYLPASVTILADDCLSADALSTAVFVLGRQKGLELVRRLPGVEVVTADFKNEKLNIFTSDRRIFKEEK